MQRSNTIRERITAVLCAALVMLSVAPLPGFARSTPAGATPAGATPAGATPAGATPAGATPAGATWYVDRYGDDGADGDIATHSGTLRFTLAHATSGDFVSFSHYDAVVDALYIGETLVVPAGVAVGYQRGATCGSYTAPFINLIASSTGVNPVIAIGGGASLSGVNLAGGTISARITGPDADLCGVGLGIRHDGDGNIIALPPMSMALVIDGARATVRRNYINAQVVVSTNGSDSRIGDAAGGTGDGNDGLRDASVTVLSGPGAAAQRVTIRDPFPRGLNGMPGMGVVGGDDDPGHANNWAQTPAILSATTFDKFATVTVTGTASPHSLVDLYFDTQVTVTRAGPVMAAGDGTFSYTGPLPGPAAQIRAVSTLDDPAHPNRVGSSSQMSAAVGVVATAPGAVEGRVWLPLAAR